MPVSDTDFTSIVAPVGDDFIEVTARIPHRAMRVSLQIDIQPLSDDPVVLTAHALETTSPRDALWRLAGGRQLPALLFVTNFQRLRGNIGSGNLAMLQSDFSAAGQKLVDVGTTPNALNAVHAAAQGKTGIVLVGGYDVLPAYKFDVLPPALRAKLGTTDTGDDDDFIVWSDQPYADVDGDGMADIPVSRVPDGRSVDFLRTGLGAGVRAQPASRFGLRNSARPFAAEVYKKLGGTDAMRVSAPALSGSYASAAVDRGGIYIMLHGAADDATAFWGEDAGQMTTAMMLSNVADVRDAVVFAGCCWGALIVEETARSNPPSVTPRHAGNSLAMRFLGGGARCFVGCTGTHYSPMGNVPGWYGGPMHTAFWTHIAAGKPPARALFDAKVDYIAGMPHGRTLPSEQAVEYKILRQFTCLGLGW
jgi:hypothetical protein